MGRNKEDIEEKEVSIPFNIRSFIAIMAGSFRRARFDMKSGQWIVTVPKTYGE